MIKKIDLVFFGSLLFFITTILKKHVYYIDILYNAVGFPLFLFVLVYFVWLYVRGQKEKKLLLSVFFYLLTSLFVSYYVFILTIIIYLVVFFVYKSNRSITDLEDVDIDYYGFALLVRKNKNFFKIKFLLFITLVYYILLFIFIRYVGILNISCLFCSF